MTLIRKILEEHGMQQGKYKELLQLWFKFPN